MTILEDLKAGRLVVVPPVSVKLLLEWADDFAEAAKKFERLEKCVLLTRAQECRDAAASPDHTTALLSLVEGMEREIEKWRKADEVWGQPTAYLVDCSFKAEKHDAAEARALAAEAERDALRALICRVEPHIDAIVCYASAMGEHEPNRIAHEVRSIASGGVLRAAETGWLIELRGSAPSWAIVNPRDYDEHWTADSTRALRFARREDAQAYIDHIGWTEAFPSEHIWDDGRTHSDATRTEQP